MIDDNARQVCAALLRNTVEGKLNPKAALELWPNDIHTQEPIYGQAWHMLYHFAADADIRERDSEYATYQKTTLLNAANDLLGLEN